MAFSRITNPSYPEATEWPYIRGPIYTRPVFASQSGQNMFRVQPIMRMPPLNGMGDAASATAAVLTGAQVCESIKDMPGPYAKCVQFNTDMAAALQKYPGDALKWQQKIADATNKCGASGTDMNTWANCYYNALTNKWYQNPLYIGIVALSAVVVLGSFFDSGNKEP